MLSDAQTLCTIKIFISIVMLGMCSDGESSQTSGSKFTKETQVLKKIYLEERIEWSQSWDLRNFIKEIWLSIRTELWAGGSHVIIWDIMNTQVRSLALTGKVLVVQPDNLCWMHGTYIKVEREEMNPSSCFWPPHMSPCVPSTPIIIIIITIINNNNTTTIIISLFKWQKIWNDQ